jgi:hypothetical protein
MWIFTISRVDVRAQLRRDFGDRVPLVEVRPLQ